MDRDLVIYGVSRALIRCVRWHGVYTRATLHKALDQVQRREEEAPVYLELLQQRRIGRPDRLAMASRYIVPLPRLPAHHDGKLLLYNAAYTRSRVVARRHAGLLS